MQLKEVPEVVARYSRPLGGISRDETLNYFRERSRADGVPLYRRNVEVAIIDNDTWQLLDRKLIYGSRPPTKIGMISKLHDRYWLSDEPYTAGVPAPIFPGPDGTGLAGQPPYEVEVAAYVQSQAE